MPATLPALVEAIASAARVPRDKLLEVHRAVAGKDLDFTRRAVEMGLLPEAHAYRLYAECLGLAFENPEVAALDPAVLTLLPEDIVRRFRALPLRQEGEGLVVAMEDPLDLLAMDAIQEVLGCAVLPAVCPPEVLRAGIEQRQRLRAGLGIESLLAGLDLGQLEQSAFASAQRLREIAGDGAIVELVDYLIEQAVRRQASDIHIEAGRELLRVRYRIDGALETVQTLPRTLQAAIVSRIKVLASLDIAERRKPQDGRFTFASGGRTVELRVSTLPALHGEKAVLRILDKRGIKLELGAQGWAVDAAEQLRAAAEAADGMVLVTGPTGSGKTTTLYAVLAGLNTQDRNLITVEDPVEYELEGVTQVQVDVKAERTFANALRSILRQDPDVVMVGEIRDPETAEIAVHAALTGHMVLSTLHTGSAVGTLTRLVDMGVPAYLTAPTLRAVVAQRLVRRLCGACAEPYDPPAQLLASCGVAGGRGFRRAKGCPSCRGKGFVGRLPVHEVLVWGGELAHAYARGAQEGDLLELATARGFRSMLADGADKAARGSTTLEEVVAVVRRA